MKGLEYAYHLKWYDPIEFDLTNYEYYGDVDNGDLTWIIPGKLLAFAGPLAESSDELGNKYLTPEDYIPIFN